MTSRFPHPGLTAAFLAAVVLFLLVFRTAPLRTDDPAFAGGGDHLHYHAMATGSVETTTPPFCYRVLVPGLARVLPLPVEDAFRLWTVVFLWGSGLVLFFILAELGFDRFFAGCGVVLYFGLDWAARFTLWNIWLSEPALFFLLSVAVWTSLRDDRRLFVAVLLLGILAKESMMFALPLYYGYHARKPWDSGTAKRTLLLGLAPVGLAVGLRLVITTEVTYDPVQLLQDIAAPRLTRDIVGTLWGGTTGTWGVVVLVFAIVGLVQNARLRRAALFFLPFVYLQPLFAKNMDRLLVVGWVLVIPLAVTGLRWAAERWQWAHWMTLGYVLQPLGFALMRHGYMPISRDTQLIGFTIWTIVIATGLLIGRKKTART